MNKLTIIISIAVLLAAGVVVSAQEQTRSITSDDFVAKRPAGAKSSAPSKKRKSVYKFARKDAGVKRKRKGSPKPPPKGEPVYSDIGVTIWKLHSGSANAAVTFPVKVEGNVEFWVAERVNSDTEFREGDKIRLAVEPSTSGYLYVVDTEVLSDGSYGDPYLIFPAGNESNRVSPGMLVDIPDQKEELPYFNIVARDPRYRGELLTVIISPVQLPIAADSKGKVTNTDELADLELGVEVSIFDRTDNDDKVYTKVEANSACGAKTRALVREESNDSKPCGSATRALTREEPTPQAVYRVKTVVGRPAVAFVRLNVSPK